MASLDQFRGYTVAGMFLVNFLGFEACPYILRHKNIYCSYADTIMPQFFFAVGFALRYSFQRRAETGGLSAAYRHAVIRSLGLAMIAILLYGGNPELPKDAEFNWVTLTSLGFWGAIKKQFHGSWFQTLMHIAVTSVWILPVIVARPRWRVLFMIGSAVLHLFLNQWFFFAHVNGATKFGGIDGGNLGFLTWTIPTMIGTLACDGMMARRAGTIGRGGLMARYFLWGVLLMAVGWGLSCLTRCYDVPEAQREELKNEKLAASPVFPPQDAFNRWLGDLKAQRWGQALAEPPFVPPPHARDKEDGKAKEIDRSAYYRKWNYWMMSQRCGSISYLTFAAGLSLVVMLVFYILADEWKIQIGVFRTLGVNALFGYVLHGLVESGVKPYMPKDIPALYMWIGFGVYFFFCWLILRNLEKNKIFIKL